MSSRINKQKKKKRILKTISIIISLLFLSVGALAFYLYDSVKDTANQMTEGSEWVGSSKRKDKVTVSDREPISLVIMGVDERKNDRGRSDTMVVVTVNPEKNSMKMLSIPRDTRTEIVGKGTQDKINHAYAFGGAKMAIETVENFLDIPVDYYVKVNMESFKDIVNALGGVTVNNSFPFSYDGYSFSKGEITLNGNEALAFTRMRKDDPRGDFGRNTRQRQVINGVINEGAQISSITKINSILNVVGENVKTNITFDEMKTIQKNYKGARNNVEQIEIKGQGGKINGVYYFNVSNEEKQKISNDLKSHLNLT
jgi:polyisoprenyl-teichoic acid--peptidoglycan teichoic acid transferase